MDTISLIRKQLVSIRNLTDAVLANLTEDSLNWSPPGTANSIGVNLLHMMAGEDIFIQEIILQKTIVWVSGEWSKKIGLSEPPGGPPESWQTAKTTHLPLEPVLGYCQAVRLATEAYLEQLKETDLDSPVIMFGQPSTVIDVLSMQVEHLACHLGDISALKGVQGLQGLPF